MSVLLQLKIFATIASISGALLLIKPAILLKSPLDPIIVRWTGLPSSNADPAALAPAGIAISAIGMIYWCAIWSGDDKFVMVSAPGRMFFAGVMAYLLLFTDRASTGLLTMFICDFSFALWLGMTVGFGGVSRGKLRDLTKKS